ncbi:porin family protein [Vibrio sp.]|nr:porin family protein [Vibrio sp.]
MKKTLLTLALLGASSTAMADSLLYGGVSVGQADYEITNQDDEQTTYSVHVGTGLLPIIGVEAGYVNHGEFELLGASDVTVSSVYAAVKPSINLGGIQVYGKAGLHSWDVASDDNSSYDDDDLDLMYGVGFDVEVFGPVAVGANYMIYEMGDGETTSLNVTATIHLL